MGELKISFDDLVGRVLMRLTFVSNEVIVFLGESQVLKKQIYSTISCPSRLVIPQFSNSSSHHNSGKKIRF